MIINNLEPIVDVSRPSSELFPYFGWGFANKRIAAELNIGKRTVGMYVTNLLGKLVLEHRVQLTA